MAMQGGSWGPYRWPAPRRVDTVDVLEESLLSGMRRRERVIEIARWCLGVIAVLAFIGLLTALAELNYRQDRECRNAGGTIVDRQCLQPVRLR